MKLSDEQCEKILNAWNKNPQDPPALLKLIRLAFPDKDVDGRSKEGRAVKEFLALNDLKARAAHEYKPKEKIELTEEQKEFVKNNVSMMNCVEMARVVFKNEELGNLHQETRTVNEYADTLGGVEIRSSREESGVEEFKPIRTFYAMLNKINKYVYEGIDKEKITNQQKREIEATIKYVNTYRFGHQMNRYNNVTDRDLFESSFVRYTYNKADLTQEEVDQFIVLSAEVVIASNIQARVAHLSRLLDDVAEDTEGRRISMALVDAINTAQTEYNQSVARQQKLLSDLKEKRSDRLKNQIRDNASILNLVEMWKNEESRQKMIKLAQLRKKSLKEEKDNLENMDEMKARIMGLSEDEI
jgi:hypothetical protein